MKKGLYFVIALFLLISCEETEKRSSVIEEKGNAQVTITQLYHKADSLRHQGIVDIELYEEYIEQALDFYEKFPEEKIAPDMLLNAGSACMFIGRYVKDFYPDDKGKVTQYANQGIDIFNIIQKVYPDYALIKNVYLGKGVIYDNILEDYDSAEYEYREFIHKYPNDSTSQNLRYYLQYLRVSPEEIMADIKSKKD